MEIYSKNGKCKAKTGVYLEDQESRFSSRVKKDEQPSRASKFPSSTLPSSKGLAKWSSNPVINHNFSEFTFPLVRKQPEFFGRKAFLRSTEHILATFYGLVFIIEGAQWHILKSEYLPIYFVRVSVKNVKYPFRILVIDNESENHIRVVDFIVNYKTKTSIKEAAVCWQDQEKFGAKFSNKSEAFQFYDTISRMASTLRKGQELENEHLDKMVKLEIHLPNSEVQSYQFMKSDKLQNALKYVCDREKLHVNNYYFHHMQRTDDSLNMALRVGDLRTDKIRLISKREMGGSLSNIIEKINDEMRIRENSTIPENFQTLHMPARATKSDTTNTKSSSITLPTRNVKRRAPQPPKLIIPRTEKPSRDVVVNGNPALEGRKIKRRAPSPPKNVGSPVTPGKDQGTSPTGCKPPRPERPPLLASQTTTPQTENVQTSNNVEKKSPFPVFIAPPPPDGPPPPIDECETPVGPVDLELDEGSVEIPAEISGIIDDTKSMDTTTSLDTKSLDSKFSKNREDENVPAEDVSKEVDVKVEVPVEENIVDLEISENEINVVAENNDKKDDENTDENITKVVRLKDTVEGESSLQKEEESTNVFKDVVKPVKVDENENSVNHENLSPEQLQALLIKTQNPGQQGPINFQNQQLFAMQQNQQMLSNILLQQMLQQQMRAPTMMTMPGVIPVASLQSMQLAGDPTQPADMISPVGTIPGMQAQFNGASYPMWSQTQPPSQTLPQPVPNPPTEPNQTEEIKPAMSSTLTSTDAPKEEEKAETPKPPLPLKEETPPLPVEEKTPPLPVKEEELVNRPLFKKMLAQLSQGKTQGIPKVSKQESTAKSTSPISPTATINKVPTSYVASAEKNNPQTKPTEDTSAPFSHGEIGGKSSYVDSAIGRQKVVTEDNVTTESLENTVTNRQSKTEVVGIERTSEHAVMVTDSAKLSSNANFSSSNAIKQESSNVLSNAQLVQNVSVNADESATHSALPLVPKPTSPTSQLGVERKVPSGVGIERKTIPVVLDNNPQIDRIKNLPTIPSSNSSVVNHNPSYQGCSLTETPKPLVSSVTIIEETHQSSNTPDPHISFVPNHNPVHQTATNTPTPPTSSHQPDVSLVARHASEVAAEKRKSQILNSPSQVHSSSPAQADRTSHKLLIEEPEIQTQRYPKTIVSPLSATVNEVSAEVKHNGEQLTYNTYATTGRIKTQNVKPPEVAKKPRHLSEPKPVVAPKPTYDIRKTNTLPAKSKKSKHIKISLSLTPEERMKIHQATAMNAAGR